jgi:PKD repeat protein
MVGEEQDGQCAPVPVAVSSVDIGASGGGGPSGGGTSQRRLARLNQAVSFSAAVSASCSQRSFSWTFGDGSSGSGAGASHAYTQPGRYTVSVTVSCTDCSGTQTSSDSFEVVVAPDMAVTKIRSEQTAGSPAANFLPGGTGGGTAPPAYLLMGARADGNLYVSADVTVTPGTGGLPLIAALREGGEASATATAIVGGSATLQHAGSSAPLTVDYEVAAGVDLDGNGRLSPEETITMLGTVRGVSSNAYATRRAGLNTEVFFGTNALVDEGADLLRAFIDGTTPPGTSATTETIAANRRLLDHNLGLNWNTGTATASITRYTYPSSSGFAMSLRDSSAMETSIGNYLRTKTVGSPPKLLKDHIAQFFVDNPAVTVHDFGPFDVEDLGVSSSILAPNAFLAFGGFFYTGSLQFHVEKTSATKIELRSVAFLPDASGRNHAFDLYDFDFDVNAFPAIVQAGFPTIGTAGRIFWVQIDITGARSAVDFDFCAESGLCGSLTPP